MINIERDRLIEDLKLLSIKEGEEFILSSGQKSNVYIDVKQTMLYGPSMHNLAKLLHEMAKKVARKSDKKFNHYNVAAGVVLGGCHLASIVAMHNPPTHVVYVRTENKDHGTQQLVEKPSCNLMREVVLFEDVVTTGQSAIKAAKLLDQSGLFVLGIVAVVDRRTEKTAKLGNYNFGALIDFEELVENNA